MNGVHDKSHHCHYSTPHSPLLITTSLLLTMNHPHCHHHQLKTRYALTSHYNLSPQSSQTTTLITTKAVDHHNPFFSPPSTLTLPTRSLGLPNISIMYIITTFPLTTTTTTTTTTQSPPSITTTRLLTLLLQHHQHHHRTRQALTSHPHHHHSHHEPPPPLSHHHNPLLLTTPTTPTATLTSPRPLTLCPEKRCLVCM